MMLYSLNIDQIFIRCLALWRMLMAQYSSHFPGVQVSSTLQVQHSPVLIKSESPFVIYAYITRLYLQP